MTERNIAYYVQTIEGRMEKKTVDTERDYVVRTNNSEKALRYLEIIGESMTAVRGAY